MRYAHDGFKTRTPSPIIERQTAAQAAQQLIAALNQPDVINALMQKRDPLDMRRSDDFSANASALDTGPTKPDTLKSSYLFANAPAGFPYNATANGVPFASLLETDGQNTSQGRLLLDKMAAGQRLNNQETLDARDVLLGVRDAISAYQSSFIPLPKDPTGFTLFTPENGAAPYYVYATEIHHAEGKRGYDTQEPSAPTYVNPHAKCFMDDTQKAALDSKLDAVRQSAAIALVPTQQDRQPSR